VNRSSVLHVIEALGGGVAAVVEDYVAHAPGLTHHVIAARRPGHDIADSIERMASTYVIMEDGHAGRVRQVRRLIRRLKPEIVHGHSSLGGVYARLGAIGLPVRVVYTPHCFAFERTDVSWASRAAFIAAEAAMSRVTDAVAAVSPREASLAKRLGAKVVIHVPNVAGASVAVLAKGTRLERTSGSRPRLSRYVVGTLGRISPQKGLAYFIEAVRAARELNLDVDWVWIGGGTPEDETRLRQAGVQITGWCTRSAAMRHLTSLDVYVHTAAWEGAPISILEAAALGTPVVARDLQALEGQPVGVRVQSPGALAAAVAGLIQRPESLSEALARMSSCAQFLTAEIQADRLLRVYGISA
jgi:glycosyltransferase involved in cell wall biosynthesis